MKKLLHERLREIKNSDCESLAAVAGVKCHAFCNRYACHKEIYKALADEIEKYYIPRPRFEDGEPVQFGKEFVDCNGHNQTLSSLTYTKGGHGYVSLNGWTKQRIDEPAKRPEPDSLEKLRDDMAEYKSDTHFAELKTEHTFGEFINRLTAIMERDA